MKILIIEDEARIAKRIERMTRDFFDKDVQILLSDSLESGLIAIENNQIDLLLLDLNLNGEDGFEILQTFVAGRFRPLLFLPIPIKLLQLLIMEFWILYPNLSINTDWSKPLHVLRHRENNRAEMFVFWR
ncbi:response regulator [Flavobacterium sp. MMS24-S5]|uniref:response regulator n=1 Tax=Flavobacterium sp. MMS24-S5 TaxID=3416605 RepID=UPI003CFC6362